MKAQSIKRLLLKGAVLVKKYLPLALGIMSAGAAVAATVTAIQEAENNEPKMTEEPEQTKVEKIVTFVKKYHKPIIFCGVSVVTGGLSTYVFCQRQKRLTIANEQMEELLRKYTQAATATIGVEGVKFVNKYQEQADIPEQSPDEDGMTLFWDPVFNYWFRASELDFVRAAKEISHEFSLNCEATVETFYENMGVDPPTDSNGRPYIGWGWIMDDDFVSSWCEYSGYIDIDCSLPQMTEDGLEYKRVIYFHTPTHCDDLEYWRCS